MARLSDDINRAFGDVVFRDVDSILAGDHWKSALKRRIAQSRVVLVIIGDRWLAELSKRDSQDTDYVRLELNTARELNIDIIPVQLDNVRLPNKAALGDLAWLGDIQQHSLTDTQDRWRFDSDKLVDIIGKTAQLQKLSDQDKKSTTAAPTNSLKPSSAVENPTNIEFSGTVKAKDSGIAVGVSTGDITVNNTIDSDNRGD